MNKNFCIIIPSRIGSTRLQNKPLINLGGQSLIQRVYKNASRICSDSYIATDSDLIKDNLKNITQNVIMTSEDHISGTDRICEAANTLQIEDDTLILNLQGDEPFIPKDLLLKVIDEFFSSTCDVITVSNDLISDDDLNNPNCVLVEVNKDSYATKFSRLDKINNPKRHIGIYGYSFKTLKKLVSLKPTQNELKYKLEQLRFIENGFSIYVSNYDKEIPSGIDTPEDVKNANIYLLNNENS